MYFRFHWCLLLIGLAHAGTVNLAQKSDFNSNPIAYLSPQFDVLANVLKNHPKGICRKQSELVISGLREFSTWAVKFYDASGRFPAGVLAGSYYELGNFDECLGIGSDPADGPLPAEIGPQYCIGKVDVDVTANYVEMGDTIWQKFRPTEKRYEDYIKQLHWAICVPDSCTSRYRETYRSLVRLAISRR